MRRFLVAIVALTLPLLAVAAGVLLVRDRADGGGPIYSPAQVEVGLKQHPTLWDGRTVRVRGVLGGVVCLTATCRWPTHQPTIQAILESGGLVDLYDLPYNGDLATHVLPLVVSFRPAWITWLENLPAISAILPPAQRLNWSASATYRIRLQHDWRGRCCEGLVLDTGSITGNIGSQFFGL